MSKSFVNSSKYATIALPRVRAHFAFGIIFVLASLNGWTSFGLNNLDSQPWPFIASTIYVAFIARRIYTPKFFGIITFLFFIGLIGAVAVSKMFEFLALRGVTMYLSIPLCFLAFYNFLCRHGFPIKIFVAMNICWLIFGIIEIFFPIVSEMFSLRRTTDGRGVTSLAPEPTFFAIQLIFMSWIIFEAEERKVSKFLLALIITNILAVIFLAKSPMGILFVFIFILFFLIYLSIHSLTSFRLHKRLVSPLFFLVIALTLSPVVLNMMSDSRLYQLFGTAEGVSSLAMLATSDASINQRLEAPVIAVAGFLLNFGMPGGFDNFLDSQQALLPIFGDFFWYNTFNNRIMSWIGSIAYELGIFGVLALVALVGSAYRGAGVYHMVILLILLFSAIPPAFPLVPVLLAVWAWRGVRVRTH